MTKMDDAGKRTYYTGSSAIEDRESVKYFHYNHRGDTVLVTDANGEILHNLNYEAYGKPTNNEGIPINTLSLTNATDPNNNTYSTGNTNGNITGGSGNNLPNLFVGASGIRYDTKTNLHYMRFRWFSPSQLRFISPDLLMDLNRYAYVSGNPVSRIDPSGLQYEEQYRTFWKSYNKAIPPPTGGFGNVYASEYYKEAMENIHPTGGFGNIYASKHYKEAMENIHPVWPFNAHAITISPGIGGIGIQIVEGDVWIFPLAGVVIPGPGFSASNVHNYDKCKYRGWFIGAGLSPIEALYCAPFVKTNKLLKEQRF